MAANVRFRSIHYNTTGDSVTWTIEILDTEAVAQVINFESTDPDESFEGLTTDLTPGVYPSSLKFGMFIRDTPAVRGGITVGPSSSLIDDIAGAKEGRFLARLKKDGIVHFVGPIIYDQCTWEDSGSPYLMNITAVDGMNRWQTTDYISEVGQLKYHTTFATIFSYDNSTLLYDGPITGVSPMTVVEHVVSLTHGSIWSVATTFVHREIYSINSPGTGWVDQGQGLWAKSVSYTNETITEDSPNTYRLTRDIDDELHRTVLELITRAIEETRMTGEYISPAPMFDTNIEWREHSMTTGDPAGLMRLHERSFIGKTWADVMKEVCRLLFWRVYYSKGRYHFEQISTRDATTFTRYKYQSDGTLIGSETAALDLNFNTLPVSPSAGGTYRFLAPFRSVEAKVTLDSSNLLEGIDWRDGVYGTKYLGRIKQTAGDQKLGMTLNIAITSTFDKIHLLLYPQSFLNLICEHNAWCIVSVRLTNITTATTYWLEQDEVSSFGVNMAWSTTFNEITHPKLRFGGSAGRYSPVNNGYTKDIRLIYAADTLPGSEDDMYDIHVSLRPEVEFLSDVGAFLWYTVHPNKFWTVANTGNNRLLFYSDTDGNLVDWVEADTNAELVFMCENEVDNSIKVKTELQWADTGQFNKSIEVYTGSVWQRSAEWSIEGTGTAVPIGELLVTEIMSLRTVPKKLYSGSFLSTLPNAESRFQRIGDYFLPLSCSKNTNYDEFSGEFMLISKTTPPDVVIIEEADTGPAIPPGPDNLEEPGEVTLYFETNEAITAASTLTEVDIINTLGASVAAGETVSIVHPTTGVSENVVLTAAIEPGDTVMYFESNVMVNSYPDASYIVLLDGGVTIDGGGAKYRYDNRIYNGATHTVPVLILDLTPLDGLSVQQINNKVKVKRNGQNLYGMDYTAAGLASSLFFWYDSGTNTITVHADFEYVDEYLGIDIDLNR